MSFCMCHSVYMSMLTGRHFGKLLPYVLIPPYVCMCVCIYAYMQWHIMVSYSSALLKSTERLMTSFLKSHIYGQTWENSEIWILKGLGGPVITVQMHHCMCLSNDFIHIVQHLSAFYHISRFNEEFSQCDFIRFLQFCLL